MPEISFVVRWPDGDEERCSSPSTIVAEYLAPGESYPLADFLARCREALTRASARVEARYGAPCPRAAAQLAAIERRAARDRTGRAAAVTCLALEKTPPQPTRGQP